MAPESASAPAVTPAKRSAPPPPANLTKPNAGQPPAKRSRDNKFDPSLLPTTSDASEILKQVEFYFSDANLPRDKFLWQLTQSDPKGEGWVSISQIASFKRMQRFKPVENIVAALRQSKELLEVSVDGAFVRRKKPLAKPSEEEYKDLNSRSLHVKGFGDETPTLQIDLEQYFRRFGEIESLRLRRTATGLFKGSVMVQFRNQSNADNYLSEPREWNGSLLDAKTKGVWIQSKIEEDGKLSPEEKRERDRKREEERRAQKHFSAFKEMERQNVIAKKKDRKEKGKGRRSRDGPTRDRSRSPRAVGDSTFAGTAVKAEVREKRPRSVSPAEKAPSLFRNKREKIDDSTAAKREAEEDLSGASKRPKSD